MKLISLYRDGRGVINSLMRHYDKSIDEAISVWMWAIRNQQCASRWLPPEDVFELNIENLWADPQRWLSKIFAFCDVDPAYRASSYDPAGRHVIGNGMRLKFTGEIRPDYRWRDELNADALSAFGRRAGKLNRSLGPSDSPPIGINL